MCTAISVTVKDNYFGRNLDFEKNFGEKITITPRKYCFKLRNGSVIDNHYAIIGMGLPYNNYPLYFDATNEAGLSMAGLNFPHFAKYMKKINGKDNIASFEFIPWVLTQCSTVLEVVDLIKNTNITDEAFNEHLGVSELHWLIADKNTAITVEQTKLGLNVFENPAGVLTNSPSFDIHMFTLSNFLSVSSKETQNMFSNKLDLKPYSRGMGGIGLPGDFSSMSRFVRACFCNLNSIFDGTEEETVNEFFHILYLVYQIRGCVKVEDSFEITHYTSCCNTDKGIYYYTTYNNSTINAVDMHRENLDGDSIITYDLIKTQDIKVQNSNTLP